MKKNKTKMYADIISLHNEVTGSCIICTVRFPNKEKIRFLVDCGLFQEEKYQLQNFSFPFDPKEINFVLVTHNHIDHVGRLPKLYKDGFTGNIYASKITSMLMPLALYNTAEILSYSFQKNPNKYKKIIEDASVPVFLNNDVLYDSKDVEGMLNNVIGKEYNQSFKITEHISATFIPNAHLLGAASILITITYKSEEPIYLYFTGDYAVNNRLFDVEENNKIYNLPINIIQESTYGTTSIDTINHTFKNDILSSIKNKETCIVTVFSQGRAQEIPYELKKMQNEGILNPSIPIYADGKLSFSYTDFYLKHKEFLKKDEIVQNFLPHNFHYVSDNLEREKLLADRSCKIILTTSGMGNYGPAQTYLPYYITRPKCSIIFCGYTTPESLGGKLKQVERYDTFNLNGLMVKRVAKIFSTNEFSGHAKKEELLDFLKKFNNIKSVIINHGNTDVKENYAREVINKISPKDVAILDNKNYIRIYAYGIAKTFNAPDMNILPRHRIKEKELF